MFRSTVFGAVAAMAMMSPWQSDAAELQTAIFAGGCFWCVESDFDGVDGVVATTSGYIGGTGANPTYRNHAATGHREAVKIDFDPARVSYGALVEAFFRSVDPTDAGGQFCDRGHSYTTAIYTVGMEQAEAANEAKAAAQAELGKSIVTPVETSGTFYPAENYHQDYYKKNPVRYKYYRFACGRDRAVEALWGDAARRGLGS